jgi:metal-dependent HD superfamily phosphatase/phosphodiesterase
MKKVVFKPDSDLERYAFDTIERRLDDKPRAKKMWELITQDSEIKACWQMANFVAVHKLGMNDHGETHAVVATASALTMLDLLTGTGVRPDVIAENYGDEDDAALIILSAMLCHDLGTMVHREDHSSLGVSFALPILDRLLSEIYDHPEKRTIIRSFILSAIYTHHGTPRPITIEGALVCIGDSTDMTKGRGRATFDAGSITIHTVSALSIERVEIRRGTTKPIELRILMSNSAGIFQVQEILAPKVRAGPLANVVDVIAVTVGGSDQNEEKIVQGIRMEGTRFVPWNDRAGNPDKLPGISAGTLE